MMTRPRLGAWMLLCVVALGTPAAAQNAFTAPGFQKNHDYFSQQPFEHIDLGTGSLILTFTDLVIPGNAGRELRFQRTYNNKDQDQPWTYGLAGMVMSVRDTWPPTPANPNDVYPAAERPELFTADGSRHQTHLLTPDPWCTVVTDCRWVATHLFWWYDRVTRTLYLPDGVINTYDTQGRLVASQDPFGTAVTLAWSAPAGGEVVVTSDLGNGQTQVVTLTIPATSQVGYNATSYVPTSMTFRGRQWTYANPAALASVTPPAVSAPGVEPPVHPPGWTYAYALNTFTGYNLLDVFVTTPHGAELRYRSTITFYPPATPGGEQTNTINLTERTVTGPNMPSGSTWTYDYDVAPPRPEWGPHTGGNRRLTAPDGTQTWLQFSQGLEVGFTRREVDQPGVGEVEREIRQYVEKPTIGYPHPSIGDAPAVKAVLTRTDLTRHGRTDRTEYLYNTGNYSDYHRPSQRDEKGEVSVVNGVEVWVRLRTTTLGYDYNFNLTPNTNGQRYFNGKVGVETVALQGETETLTREWGHNHTTGFLNELIEYGLHTGYEPDAFGNVATVKPGQIVPKQTTFTYEWGVLKNTVTPAYTIARVINPEGTVASETRAGRTTSYTYDPVFRVTRVQPPGGTHPIETSYNNIDGSNMIVARGPSSINTTFDGLGRPIATLNNVGVRTRTAYDADGRVSYESYPYTTTDLGTTLTYDGLGRVSRRTHPDASYVAYTYGAGTVAIRDENNRTTTQTWEAFGHPDDGRLVGLRDAAGQSWQYEYTALGSIAKVTAPDGTVRTWTYNDEQKLEIETHPESGTVTYGNFDSAGVPSRKTDARGTVFDTIYDNNYRVVQVTAGSRVTTTTYEAGSDNRASVSVGTVATTFTYDAAGRLATRGDTIAGRSYARTFGYDLDDRLTLLTYPSGRQVSYQYDSEHRLTRVRDETAARDVATGVTYHPSGAPTAFTSGNGVVTQITYDANRYWPRTVSAGALQLTYDNYDLTGNVQTIGDARPGMGQTIGYDALDRLTTASGPYGALTYAYNAHGNRQTAGGVTYTYQASTLRLLSQNSQNFGYDATGNMTAAGSDTFTYTPDQQMATATIGGVATTYGYDGDGWRATKSRAGQVSDYLRGPGGELLAEVQNPGTSFVVTRDYLYAGTRLLAVTGGVTPTMTFTDPSIEAGVTPVKGAHVTELRDAVNGYRAAAGLSAATWTDPSLSGAAIKALHIQELRARLNEARAALGYPAAAYTDPTLTAGNSPVRAVHLTELRALMQAPGSSGFGRYYHADVVGSVRMTTDVSGAVVARYDYQPFGEEWPSPTGTEPRKFTGAERDGETGFDYLGARYYPSQTGRFTTVDPLLDVETARVNPQLVESVRLRPE